MPKPELNSSLDIPWTLIDSSKDLMDVTFCNKKYPPPFRTSVAVYAYEPKQDNLPQEITCGHRLVYLKVSCSITGYQPTSEEKEQIIDLLDGVPEIDTSSIDKLIREYLACYGVLLNVAVFPFEAKLQKDLDRYPRIVDFEPKLREMLQAASESGELLTTSFNKVSTDTSFSSTDVVKDSWKATADVGLPKELTGGADLKLKGEMGSEYTATDKVDLGIKSEASLDTKERHATTTTLSQMYNLLTGYHAGTNRATFLMLPRPHVLQPTDHRTFIQGLRAIEGMQDFFLIVLLPKGDDKMKVDVHLQTGHFAENIELISTVSSEKQFEKKSRKIGPFSKVCLGLSLVEGGFGAVLDGLGGSPPENITDVTDGPKIFDGFETDGWQFDTSEGDPGHGAIKEIKRPTDTLSTGPNTGMSFVRRIYRREPPDKVVIDIAVRNKNSWPSKSPVFDREYEVFLRRPMNTGAVEVADVTGLLITQRSLCVQIQFGSCLQKIPIIDGIQFPSGDWIVAEPPFNLNDAVLPGRQGVLTDTESSRRDYARRRAVLQTLQSIMLASQSSPRQYEPGAVQYLQSQTFGRRLLSLLPERILQTPVNQWLGTKTLASDNLRIKDALGLNLHDLASVLGMTVSEAAQARAGLMNFGKRSATTDKSQGQEGE